MSDGADFDKFVATVLEMVVSHTGQPLQLDETQIEMLYRIYCGEMPNVDWLVERRLNEGLGRET